MALGEALEVDCGAMSVEKDGTEAYVDFTPPDDREQWFVLQPGENDITIAIDGDAAIQISFYDANA
jgi:phage-related protein